MSKISSKKNKLSIEQSKVLFEILKTRFENNKNRHKEIDWKTVQARLQSNFEKLWIINEMEETGGEPDVVGYDKKNDEYIFFDCSPESPKGRRSLCYDQEALESRKEHKPANSAIRMAKEMGIQILTEQQYRELQKLGNFDTKTSSWIETPIEIRKLGGALFAIVDTTPYFYITTVLNRTMQPERSEDQFGFDFK